MMCDDTCPNACGRCHRCAEEITRLRADISRYVSRDTERLAEVEKLREALQVVNDYLSSDWFPHKSRTGTTKSEAAYAVRAVLTGTEAPQEENVTEPLGEAHFSDPKPLG